MGKEMGIDSIVFQLQGDALRTAERVCDAMDGRLRVMKSFPIKPTKEDRRLWYQIFKRPIPRASSFIGLIHTHRGTAIPIIKNGNAKGIQIEFHGLRALKQESYSLSDNAEQIQATLQEFTSVWDESVRLMRLDRNLDLIGQRWESFSNS